MHPYQPTPCSPPSSDHQRSMDDEDKSPLSDTRVAAAARRRRKRIAIELPIDEASNLNKDEVKKWKNRIAAARARERTQHQVQELQAMVDQLWRENHQQKNMIQHLQSVILSLQPSAESMLLSVEQQMELLTTDPLPFIPPQSFQQSLGHHHHASASSMTNGILAELDGSPWLSSPTNQSHH